MSKQPQERGWEPGAMAVGEVTPCGWTCIEALPDDQFNAAGERVRRVVWMTLEKDGQTRRWVADDLLTNCNI